MIASTMNTYGNKEAETLLFSDSVPVESGNSVINTNDIPKPEVKSTRLPQKEFRKLKKKQRKKALRIEAAKLMGQKQEQNSEEANESMKAEEIKLNVERILWEARERHIDQVNAEKKRKQEEEERKKKIIQENWEKTVKSIKLHKPPNIVTTINNGDSISSSTSIATTTSFQEVKEITPVESDYGTEKDQINCPFYFKTGACRYGSSCGRQHSYPDKSVTILIKNMYEGMPVQLADEDNDDNLEYDEVEAERHYYEFFEDVHSEFQQYGSIVQFKVCNNFQMHLRGNVYVQFSKEYEAEKALKTIRGRWYAGKQLICEYCPVTNWRSAICGRYLFGFSLRVTQASWISLTFDIGHYERNQCPKGIHCNFLHVFKNPGGLYSINNRI